MFLNKNLLSDQDEAWQLPSKFHSCWNARGSYNPLEFVLRLRPDIHQALDTINPGIRSAGELEYSQIEAFSTYFHETIHWWQHVGSTIGLTLSFLYPAQSHVNYRHLKWFNQHVGQIKSIRKYNLAHAKPKSQETESDRKTNIILNNWHDIEFFRWLVIDPKRANEYLNDPYFECVGHSYKITIGSILWLLSSTIDPNFTIFPDPRNWEPEFQALKNKKQEGYFHGSQVRLSPIGAREIFEGQARFSQLQYLYSASGGNFSWDAFRSIGMLNGVYREAFDVFLKIAGVNWPDTPLAPAVGLFLLVCDIAINPTDGFPFDIDNLSFFVPSVDPGIRFLMLCNAIVEIKPSLLNAITKYSKEEYLEISELLCRKLAYRTPNTIAKNVTHWTKTHEGCKAILNEDASFDFKLENLPVRVFFARFLRFQIDKFSSPEFFCWPGIWSAGDRNGLCSLERAEELFDEHRALFLDREDGDVYLRTFPDKNEQTALKTFNTFYSWNATYELTRQWIVEDGPFDLYFFWLTSKYSRQEMEEWAAKCFEQSYGIEISSFQIL